MGLSAEDYTRVYNFAGRVAHILPYGTKIALCGMEPSFGSQWYGTGSQDEIDKAANLETCKHCNSINETTLEDVERYNAKGIRNK